jgi:ribonuclease HII
MIVGVDEAGRGCVIGPMVICGAGAESMNIEGIKDSKLLTPEKREKLAHVIKKEGIYYYKIFSPGKIDEYTRRNKLNVLEVEGFSEIIKKFDLSSKFFVDSCDVNSRRFKRNIINITGEIDIVSEHKADVKYPMVSAASILAKVKRDKFIKDIGYDLGSGYPSDKKTITFLKNWYLENKDFPDFVRESWDTIKKIKGNTKQQRLI